MRAIKLAAWAKAEGVSASHDPDPQAGAGSTMPVERAALAPRSPVVKMLSQRPASPLAKEGGTGSVLASQV
jgi:hypothetical protein